MRSLSIALALALLTGASPALAQSHDHGAHHAASDIRTTPSDGAMGPAPAQFSATFPHASRLTRLVVTRQGGDPVVIEIAAAEPALTVAAALPQLAPGNYTIAWTATGADNHVMNGIVRYMVH